jgi:UDP-3-O-[3-hydroxymyristoyl] glucosamine N-acyltransferase
MILKEVADIIHGVVYGSKNLAIKNILPPEDAQRTDLTFLFSPKTPTKAGAVVSTEKIPGKSGIIVKDCKIAMFRLLARLSRQPKRHEISALSIIRTDATMLKNCCVGPYTIIDRKVKIGTDTEIGPNCFIGENACIGRHCILHPNAVVYANSVIGNYVEIGANSVIGKEGFGYLKLKKYLRLRHIGRAVIKDFVELGAGVMVDRGTIGDTVIGAGTKIDNLVHIAHNVKIGKNCLIMGQSGIAGSSRIGNNVVLCGQVGISDHVHIGDNAVIYAKSAVFKDVPGNKEYSGIPAREHGSVLKALARLYRE